MTADNFKDGIGEVARPSKDTLDTFNKSPSEDPSQDLEDPKKIRQRRLVLWAAITSNLFGNMTFSGVNIAIPSIQADLSLSAVEVGWFFLSLMLTMAAGSVPIARLSEIVGRRKVSLCGLVIAIIGSLGSALSTTLVLMLITRALTGLGLVAIFLSTTTMVTEIYPKKERGKVLGITIGAVYISLSVGPLIAGFMVTHFGWESFFWFVAVSLIPSAILIFFVNEEKNLEVSAKLSKPVALLWVVGIALGFWGFASLGQPGFFPLLLLGIALVGLFVSMNMQSDSPLLDISLFSQSRRFSFSSVAAYISYFASFSTTPLLSMYFQYILDFSPAKAGLVMVFQPLVQASITPISGRLSDRYDQGIIASLGLGVISVGMFIFMIFLGTNTPLSILILGMCICGAGFAIFSAPNTNAIMSSVPPNRLAQASGVIVVTRLTGQITSIALTTLIFSQVIGRGVLNPAQYPSFINSLKILFGIFAPVCLIGVLASLVRGKNRE
ncbi:MAG: MFS transporter [Deltaproteobacteria bacterium]|nr:MFS transporter [Deltaproteobacteria bacterium]